MEKRVIHQDLAAGRWFTFSLLMQLANVGTDVERAIRAHKAGRELDFIHAMERALELFDLTIADPKNSRRRKELLRARYFFADQYLGINEFGFSDEYWQQYFYDYAYAAAVQRGR